MGGSIGGWQYRWVAVLVCGVVGDVTVVVTNCVVGGSIRVVVVVVVVVTWCEGGGCGGVGVRW